VLIIVRLFSGVKKLNFDVTNSDSGQVFILNYLWPNLMCNVGEICAKNDEQSLPSYHSEVLAIENALPN
jgi:hypothetical protein